MLGAVVYYSATSAYDDQLRADITSEAADLRDLYAAGGSQTLHDAVAQRLRRHFDELEYAFYDRNGKLIVGSLPATRPGIGWTSQPGPPDEEKPDKRQKLVILTAPLPNGQWIAVGEDINPVDELGKVILRAFGWGLALSITLAALGGAVLSALFLRRVDDMASAAETIIGGDLHHRIATRGTQDELDRLAATLNQMLDRIGALMETTRQITNDIAHDMRTPIGHLRQSLDDARKSSAGVPEMKLAIDRAIAEADSILETFAALLRIAQIESGSRKAGFRTLDLSEMLEGIMQTFKPSAEDAGKTLSSAIAPGISVHGDRELLVQMIINLIENALIHTPSSARVDVSLIDGPVPILEIRDNGDGIPPAEREMIFRRFYRLDRSRTSQGDGLGLALVSAIAGLHEISIAVEDNRPGTKMVLRFPPK